MSKTSIKRRLWQCPLCGGKYRIPLLLAADPEVCPMCSGTAFGDKTLSGAEAGGVEATDPATDPKRPCSRWQRFLNQLDDHPQALALAFGGTALVILILAAVIIQAGKAKTIGKQPAKKKIEITVTPTMLDGPTRFDDPMKIKWRIGFNEPVEVAEGLTIDASFKDSGDQKDPPDSTELWIRVKSTQYSLDVKLLVDGERMKLPGRRIKVPLSDYGGSDRFYIICSLSQEEHQRIANAEFVECKIGSIEFRFSDELMDALRRLQKKRIHRLEWVPNPDEPGYFNPVYHDRKGTFQKWYDDYMKENGKPEGTREK